MPGMEIELRQKQTLHVSPQLVQAAGVLQMDMQALREYVDRALEENPALDAVPEQETLRAWRTLRQQAAWIGGTAYTAAEDAPAHERGVWDRETFSLTAQLLEQLARKRTAEPLHSLCRQLILSLDTDGYLEQADLDALVAAGAGERQVSQALALVQSMEPAGVAARDLRECLLLQLRRLPEDTELAQRIAADHLALLGRKRWRALAGALKVPEEQVHRAAAQIEGLSPRPGGGEEQEPEQTVYIVPDVFVVPEDDGLRVVLNEYYTPHLRLSGQYRQLMTETTDQETRAFLRQKLRQANWVMDCLERRRRTLETCARLVLDTHLSFFRGETPYLAPLTQRAAAAQLEMHPSTLGRCVQGKYLQCRQGTYPLSWFFPHPVDEAGRWSEQALRLKLAGYVRQEDPATPLSDQRLSELLAAEGIPAARRTVAKYRQLLHIPPAWERHRD